MKIEVKASDLKLADVLHMFDGAFGTAVVHKVTDEGVYLERPYMCTDDFSSTGGVSTYIGVERFSLPKCSDRTYTVLSRKDLR